MDQLIEQLKAAALTAQNLVEKAKKTIAEYQEKLSSLVSREQSVSTREEEVATREEAVKHIENADRLREQAAEHEERVNQKEQEIDARHATERKELDAMKQKNAADLSDLQHREANLTRDWTEFKKEKAEYKQKVLAEITENQLR